MNDILEKTASSLAVVEKKPQRPGGCVGIFFQLFDWNRRFAKKKLFSKKLLPPVRLKQASKKFGGDEKQPKLRLIADENSGGFPIAKNSNGATKFDVDQKHETRVPGLVARLMGLESMPASHREKSKKVAGSGALSNKAEKFVNDNICAFGKEDFNVEKEGNKHELRPQKLQRTSVCESQSITRLGAEKLPLKNVLSKSRKPHHPKLPSPVKSPRNLSRKSSSKLIGAATRILEPGLQTNRPKCALTYSNTLHHPPQTTCMEDRTHLPSGQLEDPNGFKSVAANEQSSRNCGYFREEPQVFASPFSHCNGSSCQGSERGKPGQKTAFYRELEEKLPKENPSVAGPFIGDLRSHVKFTSYRSPFEGHIQRNSGSQQCMPPRYVGARDPVPPRSKLNSLTSNKVSSTTFMNGTKNFVSGNQGLSGSTISRVPFRKNNGKFESEKRIVNTVKDSAAPGRKRRPMSISKQGESSGFTNSTIDKQSFDLPHAMSRKQFGHNGHFINHQCDKTEMHHLQERKAESPQVDNNVFSFTFNSSVKQKTGSRTVAEREVQSDSCFDDSLHKSAVGDNGRTIEKPFPLSGDALGALLEQKLKELTFQGEDIGGDAPKKTTAMILQELISALTSEIPFQKDKLPALPDRRNSWNDQGHVFNLASPTTLQASTATSMKPSVEPPLDVEHLSPGSVLEAYYSTESCVSSNQDDSIACKILGESLDCSYYGPPQLPNPDSELLGSPASVNTANGSKKMVIDILSNVSEILCCNNLASCGLKGDKLDQANEVLSNAELVFQTAALSCSVVGKGSPIKHLLLDELETLASILWMNFGSSVGIEDGKEMNQLRRFGLDAIIEYLDLRFEGYPEAGSKVSRKLPLRMNTNMLIFEIVEVVRRWDELSRFGLDELIEKEMGHSLGEWTACETEAFETGMEISRQLYQLLVDEIVMDLWNC